MNTNNLFWPSINLIVYLCLATLAFFVCDHGQKSIQLNKEISTAMNVEGSTDLAIAELLEKLSFSLYDGATDRVAAHKLLVAEASEQKDKAQYFSILFLCLATGWLVLQFFLSRKNKDTHRLWRHVLVISILCLIVGLIAPMMQMTAYKELPVLGEVVFKYEAKSIYSTVQGLFSNGNLIIAGLITLFSIFTPLLKMSVVGMNLFNVAPSLHKKAHDLIHLLGKWSMADVFVVAILISIFALDTQEFTRAETDLGVYFFAVYCLLSLLVTHAVLKEPDGEKVNVSEFEKN